MKKVALALLLLGALQALAADKVFGWVHASDEIIQLDPSDYHGARVYRPGDRGGNLHVDIVAQQPVTVAMAWSEDWDRTVSQGGDPSQLSCRCVRKHVVNTTYTCDLSPG